VAKVIARPSCEMARRMCFAEVAQPRGVNVKKVSGRERSSFLACLDMGLRYLYYWRGAKPKLKPSHCNGL
jgi:hypothetical protein